MDKKVKKEDKKIEIDLNETDLAGKKKTSTSEERMGELENKIADLTAGWQRAQADFINFKRQAELDRARTIKTANADLIENILSVLDNFALAAKHLPKELENNAWAQGIQHIEKQLETILAEEGLEQIESIGKQFNPEFHEACDQVESDRPEGEIIEEIAPGYTFRSTVLRPAKVKVSIKK